MKHLFLSLSLALIAATLPGQKLASYTIDIWSSSGWAPQARIVNVYDANFNQLSMAYETWSLSAWNNNQLTTYSNNSAGQPTLTTTQVWNSTATTFSNASQTISTYTAGKPEIWSYSNWNGSSYNNSYRFVFGYDNNMFPLSQAFQIWSGSAWDNSSMTTFSNNAAGNTTLSLGQGWDNLTSTWVNSSLTGFTYTVNKVLVQQGQSWNGNAWQNAYKYTSGYDASLFQISSLFESWNGSAFVNQQQTSYTNNTAGSPTLQISQSYLQASSTWTNAQRVTYSYIATLPVVQTVSVMNVTDMTASLAGEVVSDGGAPVTARGICYSGSPNPTTADQVLSSGTGTGEYTVTAQGLTPGNTYYARAYATSSVSTVYGTELSFTTANYTGVSKNVEMGPRLYPVPSTDVLRVDAPVTANLSYRIYSAEGRLLVESKFPEGEKSLDIRELSKGTYILELDGTPLKFIKE